MGRYISVKQATSKPGIGINRDIYGTGNYRVFFNSTEWTVPAGVGSVRATLLGAGGGPGGSYKAGEIYRCSCYCGACRGTYFLGYIGIPASTGGGGGGGGFTVGTAQVTPGCTCCIIVGAGGTVGTNVCCFACNCNASNGTAGGYTCAFGICATGGGGGIGAYCVPGSDTCNRSTWCTVCIAPGTQGGTGNGNILVYCGSQGSTTGGYSTCSTSVGYGGASGSPLGTAINTAFVPDLLGGRAYDGKCWTEDTMWLCLNTPPLEASKYPGNIIYSQYCNTQCCNIYHAPGIPGGYISGNCCYCYNTAGSSLQNCFSGVRQVWNSACVAEQYSLQQYNGSYWEYCSKCVQPGCGAGGVPASFYYNCYCSGMEYPYQSNSYSGGNGMAVVEW